MSTINESIIEDAASYLKANWRKHSMDHLIHLFSIGCLFKRKPE
jgi:hypothetical protein